jgi:imidazolonepropionase
MRFDRLWRGARLATLAGDAGDDSGVGLIERGAIAVTAGRIAWVGAESALPATVDAAEEIDLGGRLVTPGLIDCHTHAVFGGDRSREFELRMGGADYQTIAKAGGGIRSTVQATRASSEEALLSAATPRLEALMAEGVTTVEIKSGYGLELETELRMLRVARRLASEQPIEVVTTLLAAHAVPAGRDRADYLREIVQSIIPRAAAEKLADAVDGFCEGIAFTPDELRAVFQAARAHGLEVKVHADQLSDGGGAALAAEFGALSADHLECTSAAGVAALARAGTVAVLLPGSFFSMRETRRPPVEALRQAGVRMAIATDCNPGTSPLMSILMAMNLATVLFRLSISEVLAAVTREAAFALGLQREIGTLELGKRADLAIWNAQRPVDLFYWLGGNPLHARVRSGQWLQ